MSLLKYAALAANDPDLEEVVTSATAAGSGDGDSYAMVANSIAAKAAEEDAAVAATKITKKGRKAHTDTATADKDTGDGN